MIPEKGIRLLCNKFVRCNFSYISIDLYQLAKVSREVELESFEYYRKLAQYTWNWSATLWSNRISMLTKVTILNISFKTMEIWHWMLVRNPEFHNLLWCLKDCKFYTKNIDPDQILFPWFHPSNMKSRKTVFYDCASQQRLKEIYEKYFFIFPSVR